MPPRFYTARYGPARLTPAALPKVVRRPAFLASSSCGRHEYSQCSDIQTSDAHHRLIPSPYRGGGILNERIN